MITSYSKHSSLGELIQTEDYVLQQTLFTGRVNTSRRSRLTANTLHWESYYKQKNTSYSKHSSLGELLQAEDHVLQQTLFTGRVNTSRRSRLTANTLHWESYNKQKIMSYSKHSSLGELLEPEEHVLQQTLFTGRVIRSRRTRLTANTLHWEKDHVLQQTLFTGELLLEPEEHVLQQTLFTGRVIRSRRTRLTANTLHWESYYKQKITSYSKHSSLGELLQTEDHVLQQTLFTGRVITNRRSRLTENTLHWVSYYKQKITSYSKHSSLGELYKQKITSYSKHSSLGELIQAEKHVLQQTLFTGRVITSRRSRLTANTLHWESLYKQKITSYSKHSSLGEFIQTEDHVLQQTLFTGRVNTNRRTRLTANTLHWESYYKQKNTSYSKHTSLGARVITNRRSRLTSNNLHCESYYKQKNTSYSKHSSLGELLQTEEHVLSTANTFHWESLYKQKNTSYSKHSSLGELLQTEEHVTANTLHLESYYKQKNTSYVWVKY
ncbi:Hypothetical predicted protein [Mytilus galloprovincialis]|uniref:Uncharacterized protein n=1 Tax=Mytilus galloprovincialis TaxID=29158 RepID=A0A8B6DBC2_MYTGA|nr:Hypothetical predicted protein [Mytilus galloprovincialis]